MYFNKQFCERTTTYYVIRIKINDIFIYPDHPELFPRIILKKKNLISLVNNQISNTSFSIKIEFKKKSQIFSLVHQKSYPHRSLFKTFQIFLQLAKNSQENSHQISPPKLFKIQPINISSLLLLFFYRRVVFFSIHIPIPSAD